MRTLVLIWTCLVVAPAIADSLAPAMFTNCPQAKTLKTPANGNGVYFNQDCKVAYVLPPRQGRIVLSEPTKTPSTQFCNVVNSAAHSMKAQVAMVNRLVREIEQEEARLAFSNLKDPWVGGVETPSSDLNPQLEKLNEQREKALEISMQVLQKLEKYAEYEGPKMRITVVADQQEMVRAYQELNPQIQMRAYPIHKSSLSLPVHPSNTFGKAPAALYLGISGLAIPARQLTGLEPGDETKPGPQVIQFQSAASGLLVLSLYGACPYIDPATGELPAQMKGSDLSKHLAPTVDYVYNVEVNRSYQAEYNVAELFKRLQKQSTRGGFFTTRTIHSLVIENDSSGWFRFKSLSEHPNHLWDKELAQTIKAGVISRLLARLDANPVSASDVPGQLPPGKNGADGTADGLKNCPNVYCQAGAYILRALSATVGGTDAVSQFIRANNYWEKEEVSESVMVPQIGQVSFEKDK